MNWISITIESLPLETQILVKSKYGVEGIHFFNAEWKYWYSGNPVRKEVLEAITHWLNPNNEDCEHPFKFVASLGAKHNCLKCGRDI